LEPGGLFERSAEQRVRTLEIAILRRDGRIDQQTQQALGENAESHARFGVPLVGLDQYRDRGI
jgi:hypothetical protein